MPADHDPFGRKVDPRVYHPRKCRNCLFDSLHAAAAMYGWHGKAGLVQSITDDTARQEHFFMLTRMPRTNRRDVMRVPGRAATHRATPRSRPPLPASRLLRISNRAIGVPGAVPQHREYDDQAYKAGDEAK